MGLPHLSSSLSASDAPHGTTGSAALSDYPAALIELTLERVIASNTFRRSQRHRDFLVHVVRAGLAGRHDQLKEVIIGLEVFGRTLPDYDPRRDPIVRVEAGRIRDKLARFYDSEGASESFQIVIPIGSYLPQFGQRKFVPKPPQSIALAVLPFINLAGDPDDASVAYGIADQLVDTLGRVHGLKLVARLSALKAHHVGMDVREIGKALGVSHVVEGSLQRGGTRLRCFAHLVRTRDGVRIWSHRFDHDSDDENDLFNFQDTVAEAVLCAVSTLQVPTAFDERTKRSLSDLLPAHPDAEARELFERARTACQQGTVDGYEKGIALLERAIDHDPGFAQAHSHLAAALVNQAGLIFAPTYPAFDRVKQAVHHALELDPLDGEARALLAVIAYRIDFDWSAAEPMFHEALRLAPNAPLIHASFAWGLVFHGRFDEAMQHARLAQELDPLSLGLRAGNAAIAQFARQDDLAIREFEAVLERDPAHLFANMMLGTTLTMIGEHDRAMPYFDEVCRLMPTHASPRFARACVQARRHDTALARQELEALLARIGNDHYSRFNLAMAQVCLGDVDGAFESLEFAAQARDVLFVSLPVHRLFDALRDDPRYVDLARRHHLPLLPHGIADKA